MFRFLVAALAAVLFAGSASAQCANGVCLVPGYGYYHVSQPGEIKSYQPVGPSMIRTVADMDFVKSYTDAHREKMVVRSGGIRQRYTPLANATVNLRDRWAARGGLRGRAGCR